MGSAASSFASCSSSSSSSDEGDWIDSLVFMPPKRSLIEGDRIMPHLDTVDGKLAYRVFSSDSSEARPKKLMIFAHGNACDLFSLGPDLYYLASKLGIPVLAFDYPGYGESEGVPTEASAYRSLARIVDHATQTMGYHPSQILLCGQSLGTGVVAHYAYFSRGFWEAPIVLISPFRSIVKVVSHSPLFGTLGSFASLASPLDRFVSEAKMKDLRCPVKIVHGLADTLIPPDHARALLESLPLHLRLTPTFLEGIGHNDILDKIPFEEIKTLLT